MHYDFLILGQGIAGTLLSYEFKKRGRRVLVVDNASAHAASRVAGAVLNPVSGKALWQTRKQETLLPFAINKYKELEEAWGLPLLTEMPLLHFHTEERLRAYFEARAQEIPKLLQALPPEEVAGWKSFFQFDHSIGAVNCCHVIAARKLLLYWRKRLEAAGVLVAENWEWPALELTKGGVAYKSFTASKLICCEGAAVRHNPFFKALPFTKNKGEALLVKAPSLPRGLMYQHGIRLTPWDEHLFWAGSHQMWDYEALAPDLKWRTQTEQQLKEWLKIPFEIVDHLYAERPTTAGQIIYAGRHSQHGQVVLLNGLGTRGFLAGPFYAEQLARQLCGEEELGTVKHRPE